MCKTVNFLQGVAVASSVFTITAMSVDRYLAITQSLRQPWMPSRRGACLLLAVLWLVAFAIFAPLLVVASVEREVVPLLSTTENGSVWVESSIEFCTEKWPNSINKELFGAFSFILVYAVPGHANSAINPIVYCLMTRNFRRSLRKLLCQDPGNIHSSTHFHMQGLRQKSNTSSMRTCTTVTFRSSGNQSGRGHSPNIQYGKVHRNNSLREPVWKDRHQTRSAQFL
ncbi:Neuropeptide FF receptor 1 [Papilio machaon]|uniref:Neuropeptide FF receptor 1 n=1 Tax=Papilio machaon TaxID=76193 RepID=A0A194RG68_PAPMA|nr:Neuropeptide FF receptor 1 [Papilio machaon]